ncbi:hypothetical protein B484DRAFT_450092 [Ochromonadaceae sp. CCMP2298]|nr:hypothetical protein B484DRAFT_450092 [Ochromonadaceae sp. CCMP2298]|mmetsp:Transcript_33125/g.71609  ORF Transcript_33125/g.71609 Transcript_33125/m.71609 type:complete len:354 (-) Transcript_33125:118-1179(-)|eukprot:CAMPEP_0173171698 /NCGR_PEP_ID=MMETSP1141-20130122/1902_1 /TAXON_ID=483371 /ORGANISM="non described non described, Strain CCMP2298" /LENGTH=353 /DNA_ID=CAMNT_0014093661 /DNA_START=57 /DNA_END=1118 /DNA_ORIENTATION=-
MRLPCVCSRAFVGDFQVLASTVLFSLSYVGCRRATGEVAGPFAFNALRFLASTLLLVGLRGPLQRHLNSTPPSTGGERVELLIRLKGCFPPSLSETTFNLFLFGGLGGLSNFLMSTFAQFGFETVSAGKGAFIIGLYVIVTPFAEMLLPGAKTALTSLTWVSVALSGLGTYLLSGTTSTAIHGGEMLMFLAMLGNVGSILASDAGAKRVDCVDLTCIDFALTTLLSTIASLLLETNHPLRTISHGYRMILLVAVVGALAFLLCTLGQMTTTPTRAAIILSLEAVFTVMLGYYWLGEHLNTVELVGCGLMFAATVISTSCELSTSDASDALDEGVESEQPITQTVAKIDYGSIP